MMRMILALALLPHLALAAPPAPLDPKLEKAAREAVDKGIEFLKKQQAANGSYGDHVGLTGMALNAFATSPHHYDAKAGPFVAKAVEWMVAQQKPNGSITGDATPTYNTALAVLALSHLDKAAYAKPIAEGQKYLAGDILDEEEKIDPSHQYYGGMGYSAADPRADLSNLQFGLEALQASDYQPDSEAWKKAQIFISRCQNRSESNDQAWAGNDGGFTYRPGGEDGSTASYGAMTFAGLKSLIFSQAKKEDPRVQAAWGWVGKNYGFADHPGHGTTAYYYYLETAASALRAFGERNVVDERGRNHDWAADMIAQIVGMQKPDGSWKNDNAKYWEGNPVLATARAVIALNHALAATAPPAK